MHKWLLLLVLSIIAIGTLWNGYENHIANTGVIAWQHQFDEIAHPPDSYSNGGYAAPTASPTPMSPTYSE